MAYNLPLNTRQMSGNLGSCPQLQRSFTLILLLSSSGNDCIRMYSLCIWLPFQKASKDPLKGLIINILKI